MILTMTCIQETLGALTVYFVVLILSVFDGGDVKGCSVWKNESIWFLLLYKEGQIHKYSEKRSLKSVCSHQVSNKRVA